MVSVGGANSLGRYCMKPEAAFWVQTTKNQVRAQTVSHVLSQHLHEILPSEVDPKSYSLQVLQQGWYNLAIRASSAKFKDYVIRVQAVSDDFPTERSPFAKEVFLLQNLKDLFPVPVLPKNPSGVVTLGTIIGNCHFIVQEHVQNLPYKNPTQTTREQVTETLAWYASQLHRFTLHGYGSTFDEKNQNFSHPEWKDEVKGIIETLSDPILLKDSLFPASLIINSIKLVEELEDIDAPPTLFHLDFLSNWSNVLFSRSGDIAALIDWENAGSGLAFEREISSYIYCKFRDGESREQIIFDISLFLNAYGISEDEFYEKHYSIVRAFLVREALLALRKYQQRKMDGILFREPWRKTFARRALCLLRWAQTGELIEQLQDVA